MRRRYMIRIRNVLTDSEHWLIDSQGETVWSDDRLPADLMALAVTSSAEGRLGVVVRVDTDSCGEVLAMDAM